MSTPTFFLLFFFFNDPAPTEISPLPLHDALPISFFAAAILSLLWIPLWLATERLIPPAVQPRGAAGGVHSEGLLRDPRLWALVAANAIRDRKSTRLNSSHQIISYAVFCLKKKTLR